MKLVVWKNHLGGQILYRRLDPSKKRRQLNRIQVPLDPEPNNVLSNVAEIFLPSLEELLKNSKFYTAAYTFYVIFFAKLWTFFGQNCPILLAEISTFFLLQKFRHLLKIFSKFWHLLSKILSKFRLFFAKIWTFLTRI